MAFKKIKNAKKSWEEHSREELKAIPFMKSKGFHESFDTRDLDKGRTIPENPPKWNIKFLNKDFWVWFDYEEQVWISAYLNENCNLVNKRKFHNVEDAANRDMP